MTLHVIEHKSIEKSLTIDVKKVIAVGEVRSVYGDDVAGWTYGFNIYVMGRETPLVYHGVRHFDGADYPKKNKELEDLIGKLRTLLIVSMSTTSP